MPGSVIFDIDGTLTQSTGVDDDCFVEAIARVFDIHVTDTDWSHYDHSTDDGLTYEIVARATGHPPSAAEIAKARGVFLELLAEKLRAEPQRCRAVPGAGRMIEHLLDRGWNVALASGAWEPSARLKLASASLQLDHLPSAFSHLLQDDSPAQRWQIITKACGHLNIRASEIVYVGDGLWDLHATRYLGCGFFGIVHTGKPDRLSALLSSSDITSDYTQLDAFEAALTRLLPNATHQGPRS